MKILFPNGAERELQLPHLVLIRDALEIVAPEIEQMQVRAEALFLIECAIDAEQKAKARAA